jgi:hypothetical protein
MKSIRQRLQAQPKKSMFTVQYLKKKEPKIRMRTTRQNLQAQPKILKKY